jgi:hypothetical protein
LWFLALASVLNLVTTKPCGGTVTIDYGSGSDFWQFTVPVPVPAPYLDHKSSFNNKNFGKKPCLINVN